MKKCSLIISIILLFTTISFEVSANNNFRPEWPLKDAFKVCAADVRTSGGKHTGIDTNHNNKTTQNVYPVANGCVTQVVNCCSCYNAYKSKYQTHANVDCDAGNSGNKVVLKHNINGRTYYSQYAHLTKDSITVNVGEEVTTETILGKMGSSGNSSGPHLHFSIYEGNYTDKKAGQTFSYYKNNPEVMKKLSVKKEIAEHSELYGDWIKENGELKGGLYYFNNLSDSTVDAKSDTPKSGKTDDSGNDSKKSCIWHISYNSLGYCKSCDAEYSMNISTMSPTIYQTVKDNVPVRNRPYSPEKVTKWLSKGTKVTVVASGKNSAGNLWYKLNDGSWIYSKNLEKVKEVEPEASTLRINVTQYPATINQGKSFGLRGEINSNYSVTSVKGYIINSSGKTVMTTSDSPNAKANDIRYLNLNQDMFFGDLSAGKYTLKIVAKDSSGESEEWKKDFTVKGDEPKQEVVECKHSYNKSGYCSKCDKEYAISLTSINPTTYEAVKNDVPVRNRPYSPDKIIKYLSKGAKVTVIASGKNSVGNLWYKLNDGTWVYSENLKKSSGSTSTGSSQTTTSSSSSIKISLDSYPKGKLPYGKSFTLSGKFTSDCAIVEARAYMLDSDKNVIMEAKGSSTTSNYYIKGYALDKGMKFSELKPGEYYLKYYVKDANGDTATWISDKFYIVK